MASRPRLMRRLRQVGTKPSRVVITNWKDLEHPEAGGAEVFCEEIAAGLGRLGVGVTRNDRIRVYRSAGIAIRHLSGCTPLASLSSSFHRRGHRFPGRHSLLQSIGD